MISQADSLVCLSGVYVAYIIYLTTKTETLKTKLISWLLWGLFFIPFYIKTWLILIVN